MISRPLFNGNQPLIKGVISNDIPVEHHDGSWQSPPNARHIEVTALMDSGATISCIDARLCTSLRLRHYGVTNILHLDETQSSFRNTYVARFEFFISENDNKKIELPDYLNAVAMPLKGRAYNVVIGMDVLTRGVFTVNGSDSFQFSF